MNVFARILSLLLVIGLVPGQAFALRNTGEDVLNVGKPGSSANKELRLGTGKLQYDTASGKLKFTNDGTIFKDVGSGSGSGSGIVLNQNTGFEDGLDQWTSSPGVAAISNTQPAFGVNSIALTFAAGGQYLRGQAVVVPYGLGGKACTISWYYKGGTGNTVTRVLDASFAPIASSAVNAASSAWSAKKIMAFTCPAAGTLIYPEVYAAAADSISFDEVKLGQELVNLPAPNGASRMGSIKIACSGGQFSGGSTSDADFNPQTGCTYTVESGSKGIAAPSTNLPGLSFTPDDIGAKYEFVFSGNIGEDSNGPSTKTAVFRLYDGTNYGIEDPKTENQNGNAAGVTIKVPHVIQSLGFSDLTTRQVRMRYRINSGSLTLGGSTAHPLTITVYKWPTTANQDAMQGLTADQAGWEIEGNIFGANVVLPDTLAFTEASNGSLQLTTRSYSAPVEIACSGTNPSSGATCSAGNEVFGIALVPPTAGRYEVCMNVNGQIGNLAQNATANFSLKLVETPNNAQTILQEGGKNTVFGNYRLGAGDSNTLSWQELRVCGNFVFNDTSKRTIRMVSQWNNGATGSGILYADRNSGLYRDLNFTVKRRVEYADAVKFTNLVTSSAQEGRKVVTASLKFDTSGAGGCSINSQDGSWVSTPTYNGNSDCTFPLAGFANKPRCTPYVVTDGGASQVYTVTTKAISSTSIRLYCAGMNFGAGAIGSIPQPCVSLAGATEVNLTCVGN